jgi:hypothetical protein
LVGGFRLLFDVLKEIVEGFGDGCGSVSQFAEGIFQDQADEPRD